jgi:hypothetical protein
MSGTIYRVTIPIKNNDDVLRMLAIVEQAIKKQEEENQGSKQSVNEALLTQHKSRTLETIQCLSAQTTIYPVPSPTLGIRYPQSSHNVRQSSPIRYYSGNHVYTEQEWLRKPIGSCDHWTGNEEPA